MSGEWRGDRIFLKKSDRGTREGAPAHLEKGLQNGGDPGRRRVGGRRIMLGITYTFFFLPFANPTAYARGVVPRTIAIYRFISYLYPFLFLLSVVS